MSRLGKQMAVGAVWMVALKFIERGIGFVSTLVLARLLVPGDFGLVAMAMAVFAFVEIAGSFGFDLALLRKQDSPREAYDSAWTLQLIWGLIAAVLVLVLAWPAAAFFGDERIVPVMLVLALCAAGQGFENIGTVYFRKEFRFGMDFKFMLYKKLVAFAVTMALAFSLRNHWALVAGMAASRLAGVVFSFSLHPYRPRWDLSHAGELFGFSRWMVVARVIEYIKGRGPDFLIGRWLDAAALGLFRVASEIATLPTTELLYPIMRAVFPGYAAVAHDRSALARSFLGVQGALLLLTLPAALAIVLLSDAVVQLLLGPKWAAAGPLIQVLGLYGALSLFQLTSITVFNALGVPKQGAALRAAEVLLLLPGMAFALHAGWGVIGAAWLVVGVQVLLVPLSAWMLQRQLPMSLRQRWAVTWRPLLGGLGMALTLAGVLQMLPLDGGAWRAAGVLFTAGGLGLIVYIALVGLGWLIAGRPDGAESVVWQRFRHAQT